MMKKIKPLVIKKVDKEELKKLGMVVMTKDKRDAKK
jgi:hypothetical protein